MNCFLSQKGRLLCQSFVKLLNSRCAESSSITSFLTQDGNFLSIQLIISSNLLNIFKGNTSCSSSLSYRYPHFSYWSPIYQGEGSWIVERSTSRGHSVSSLCRPPFDVSLLHYITHFNIILAYISSVRRYEGPLY